MAYDQAKADLDKFLMTGRISELGRNEILALMDNPVVPQWLYDALRYSLLEKLK